MPLPQQWKQAGASFGDDGLLYLGEWRNGFTVDQLRALFFECQEARALRREVKNLTSHLAEAEQRADLADQRARWYRQQLTLESRLGMCLRRIAL